MREQRSVLPAEGYRKYDGEKAENVRALTPQFKELVDAIAHVQKVSRAEVVRKALEIYFELPEVKACAKKGGADE